MVEQQPSPATWASSRTTLARLPEPDTKDEMSRPWFPWQPLLAAVCLALLAACTQQQVVSGTLGFGLLGDPEAAHECLHEDGGECWVLLHLSNAQHFCRKALEEEAPRPLRWEEVSLDDPLLIGLVEAVPGTDLVFLGKGTPAFHSYRWHDRDQGQVSLVGAYDLQSRTGINEWTPWEYDCIYDTFRYEVVGVAVGPVQDQ